MRSRPPFFRAATAALLLACAGHPTLHAQEPATTPAAPVLSAITPAPAAPATPTPAADASPAPKPDASIENSVVKIFATVRYPDPYRPWTKQAPQDITGSGAVIAGHRILTNAHVVLYASQIQVQANQAGDKLSATVEAVAPGIDLAVLKLDDDAFFDTHAALSARQDPARHQGRRHGLRLPGGRHEPVHHQGHRLAHRVRALQRPRRRACASRSTPPSTPAIQRRPGRRRATA